MRILYRTAPAIEERHPAFQKNGRIKIPGGRGACRTPELLPGALGGAEFYERFDLLIFDFDLRLTGV